MKEDLVRNVFFHYTMGSNFVFPTFFKMPSFVQKKESPTGLEQ